MGFERILGELTFPDDNIEDWLDAEVDPYDLFAPHDFWTQTVETALREGQLDEDPPQGVQELLDSIELDSGELELKRSGNRIYIDAVCDDVGEDAYFMEAFKLAAAFAKAAEFDAEGELTFSNGYHTVESAVDGRTFDVTIELRNGEAHTSEGNE